MSDTPRTERHWYVNTMNSERVVPAYEMEKLERELAAKTAEVERLRADVEIAKTEVDWLRNQCRQINDWCCYATEEDITARLMALQQIGVLARAAFTTDEAAT